MALSAAANAELSYWIDLAKRYPVLSSSEEALLAHQARAGDGPAADRLLLAHLRFVVKMARKYSGYGLPPADLVNEGVVGLMHALKKFEPEKGFRFSTYAGWWIRAEMQSFIIRSRSMVKFGTTGAQKKLFFNLARTRAAIQSDNDGVLPDDYAEILARAFNVSVDEIRSAEQRLTGDTSLNVTTSDESDEEMIDFLVDPDPSPESVIIASDQATNRLTVLHNALTVLNPRERRVIQARRLVDEAETMTLYDLSLELKVSRERVRQIEARAMEKLSDAAVRQAQLLQYEHAPRNENALDFADVA
jgi:RNA polymerase sigma-32 factor